MDDDDPDPRTKIPLRESPFLNRYSRMKEVPCTPQRRIYSDGISCSADDASVCDSGFWELESVETGRLSHSSPWSTQQHQSSSPCSEDDDSIENADWESFVDVNSSKERRFAVLRSHSPAIIQGTTPQNLFERANLPSYIKLGPEKSTSVGKAAEDEDEEGTVYGSLFEQLDPWGTVGMILGLPEIIASKNNSSSNSLPLDRNSQAENSDFETATVVPQARVNELWEDEVDYDEEFDSLFDGTWRTSSPIPQPIGMDVMEVDTIPIRSSRELTSPVSPSKSFVEELRDANAHSGGNHGTQPLDINESSTSQRESREHFFAGSGDGGSMAMFGKSNDGGAEENSGRHYVPRCFTALEDDVRSENDMDCDGNEGGRNFDPIFQEVDGRFVGPTLFDDFDDSEEE